MPDESPTFSDPIAYPDATPLAMWAKAPCPPEPNDELVLAEIEGRHLDI